MTDFKKILLLTVTGFVFLCGLLVVQSGFFRNPSKFILLQNPVQQPESASEKKADPNENLQLKADNQIELGADHAQKETVILGSTEPNTEFELELKLTSEGAAVETVTFSEYKNRDNKDKPLTVLSPVRFPNGRQIFSFANTNFVLKNLKQKLPLGQLYWKTMPVKESRDGSQSVTFEAVILNRSNNHPVVKLVKTYTVKPSSYDIDCNLVIENFTDDQHDISFNLNGPLGIEEESYRGDARKVIGGYRQINEQVARTKLEIKDLKNPSLEKRKLIGTGKFLWAAITNKYFASIVVPVADKTNSVDWLVDKVGQYYNPDADEKDDSGDETIGLDFSIRSKLNPVGLAGSTDSFNFKIFVGPKDKRLFDKNPFYRSMGFVQAIDFMACMCCPAVIINPIAFGILAIMEWIYYVIPNYGIAIIILVFIIRLIMHPLTKKSQVSMSKMGKLAPKMEEIKKKYANDKTEMNKQMMALYKEHGASPFLGMVPMFIQMPIWVALYSSIDASVSLRQASFLPYWITDLSAPDALIKFTAITLPLFGKLDSVNLLPILMGVAFYLQQKMTPTQPAASSNPQMEQQQKMMKIIFPLLFPLMLYKSPSGLNLYIMASTFVGVIEQYVIRKHIREKDQQQQVGLVEVTSKTGGKVKKKKPKPFFKLH